MGAASLLQAERAGDFFAGTFRQKSRAQQMAHGMGGLVRVRAASRDPSLARRVPPHSAEQQEQPAHWLETPLAAPLRACSWQGRSRVQLPQGRIGERGVPHGLSAAASLLGSLEQGGGMGRGSLSPGSADLQPSLCNPGGVFKGQPTVET